MKRKFKVGDFVSMWKRENPSDEWYMEYGFVLLTKLNGKDISFQHSLTHSRNGGESPTSCFLKGNEESCCLVDSNLMWQRELREPIFDIKPNKL